MPVGSHKDAFKAHQLIKKLVSKEFKAELAQLAADVLMDFVKHQRQVNSERVPESLPRDETDYGTEPPRKALEAVEGLCGKCDERHENGCFVNQARRIFIAAKNRVELGPTLDGKKKL
ncbi:MAG: hypothetical protein HQK55_11350, partial [Deltaproteobacteria bacterium]|nr:hypothetical protein [Deltaproteobacteria bacterium]